MARDTSRKVKSAFKVKFAESAYYGAYAPLSDDDLVRRLLRAVKVINESKIEIQFQSGIMITQRMDFED